MNAVERKIQELHELLADEYRKQPYVTTNNIRTQALWNEINRLEDET